MFLYKIRENIRSIEAVKTTSFIIRPLVFAYTHNILFHEFINIDIGYYMSTSLFDVVY